MTTEATAQQTTHAVLSVLAGTPLHHAAAELGITPEDLAAAVDTYQAAGQAALETQAATRDWHQILVHPTDWATAEDAMAQHLAPHLDHLHQDGLLSRWWFIRKAPHWRLRFQPGPDAAIDELRAAITTTLDQLTRTSAIRHWQTSLYEPETLAFGGEPAIDIAHDLFHADSHAILHQSRPDRGRPGKGGTLGRRELSILLCSGLFRAAGQDWHDQGDVWHRITHLRPLPPDAPADRLPAMATALRRLATTATTDPTLGPSRSGGPLEHAQPWLAAFTTAGHRLDHAAHAGNLQRGLRRVLAHHVIFHWNRLGLTDRTQAVLAHAARDSILNPQDQLPSTDSAML